VSELGVAPGAAQVMTGLAVTLSAAVMLGNTTLAVLVLVVAARVASAIVSAGGTTSVGL
jgi:hypothetical protein